MRWAGRATFLRILPFAGLGLAIALLACFVDLRAALAALAAADPGWIAAAVVATLVAPLIVGVKLAVVAQMADLDLRLTRCVSAVLGAVTLNAILPGRGGDFVRASFLATGPGTLPPLLGAVLLERFVDVFVLGAMALLASAAPGAPAGAIPWLAAGACLSAGCGALAMALGHRLPWPRGAGVAERALRFGQAARALLARPRLAALLVLASLASWIDSVVVMGCCLRAVDAPVPPVGLLRATPIAILAGIAPVSVGGIGTRDAALALLLAPYAPAESLVAGGFAYTALTSGFLGVLGGLALGLEARSRTRPGVGSTAPTGRRT
jgi:uncharacterized membrane protein YbhN (UPF0104 family)